LHTAGKGPVLVLHVLWFGAWVTVNSGMVRIRRFDPFPFSVSHDDGVAGGNLLSALRLGKRNGLSRQADKRSHLDLQIDLLAEREMTAVLQLLQDIAGHLKVRTSVTPEQLRDLMKKTDLRRLTNRMEELAERPARRHQRVRFRGRLSACGGIVTQEQEANGHQSTVQHLHFAVLCSRPDRSRGRNLKGKHFEVKGRAGSKRARALVTAALTGRR
jgi:hypothetical protein